MKTDKLIARKIQAIQSLKNVIYDLHGCEAEYVGAEAVTEYFNDEVIWDGTVEIFNVRGYPDAKRCYAWSQGRGKRKGKRFVAVLELPPVNSPQTAVKAAVTSKIENAKRRLKKVGRPTSGKDAAGSPR